MNSWVMSFLAGLCLMTLVQAQDLPTGSTLKDDNTLFLTHLDGPGMEVDFAKGNPKPVKMDGSALIFGEGKFGKALSMPGPIISYEPKDNINPLKGSLDFWLMDLDFDHSTWAGRRYLFHCAGWGDGKLWYIQVLLERDVLVWRQLFFGMGGDGRVTIRHSACKYLGE